MRRLILAGLTLTTFSLTACEVINSSEDVPINTSSQAETIKASPRMANVFRTPTCGCCGIWIEHAEKNSFVVSDHQQEDLTSVKEKYGITPELSSCHTTISQGYVFEGHIPAIEITAFLENPTKDVIGLSVPGMPIGSPEMEMGNRSQPYKVLALHSDGSTSVFAKY